MSTEPKNNRQRTPTMKPSLFPSAVPPGWLDRRAAAPKAAPARSMKRLLTTLFGLLTACALPAQPADYVWHTPSRNSSESMPCGGGDIGMNVWVEEGDILIYISRSGAYDEHNTLLKQGRLRIRLGDGWQERTDFRQTLHLGEGYVELASGGERVVVWADVFSPTIRIEAAAQRAVTCRVAYENWRYRPRPFRPGEPKQNALKWSDTDGLGTAADTVRVEGAGRLVFFHRNPARTLFDRTVEAEGLAGVKEQLWNPLAHRVSGGRMQCDGMEFVGTSPGEYAGTDFCAWNFRSRQPARRHAVTVTLHTRQTPSDAEWYAGLAAVERQTAGAAAVRAARERSRAWWRAFWQRSWIESEHAEAARLARNYTLFRYLLGCNAYGSEPTKFNGGLFTFDPVHVDSASAYTPDYRNWGGGTMTAQNQRLVYWPLLKSGDTELMRPQFECYLRMLPNAELRTRTYWGHAGGCFTEQTEQFGLPNFVEYGLNRPAWFDPGVEYNAWLEYEWDTVLEFCQMILEAHRYAAVDIGRYIPLIESALTFFDEHYQYLAARRGSQPLDGDGKLILYPGSAGETYKMTCNAASTVAALQRVLTTYIGLCSACGRDAGPWQAMLARIPAIPHRIVEGRETIAPARSWERINNVETPQLYPVFPWRIYGMAADEPLEIARNTYRYDPDALRFRSSKGWKQDNIWAACLGLTEEAVRLNCEKLADGPYRYPAFWGPGFDWSPDHNWGGSAMIGLQEMLMQCDGGRIVLFPAWPAAWDVRFRLHAPGGTTVEAELRGGRIEKLNVLPEERRKEVIIQL